MRDLRTARSTAELVNDRYSAWAGENGTVARAVPCQVSAISVGVGWHGDGSRRAGCGDGEPRCDGCRGEGRQGATDDLHVVLLV